jgi:secretion/DNA translocation related TadE-like protein
MTDQRGSATVALAGAAFAVVILGSVAWGVGTSVILRHQVASAVDLAALAAADVARGVIPGEPCRMARALLTKGGVEMLACDEFEDSIVVQGLRTSGLHSVIATARAGVVDGGEK